MVAVVTRLLFVLAVVALAAISSFELAVALCNHLLINERAFDFVCGHNAPIQLAPSFILFALLYSCVGRVMMRAMRRRM